MLKAVRTSFLGVTVLTIAACSSAPSSDDVSGATSEIVGGRIDDDAADRSIVAVITPNKPSWVCTGTLIAPKVVLTAGHCVEGGNSDKTGWSFKVFFGVDRENPKSTDETIDVKAFHFPQMYRDFLDSMKNSDPSDPLGSQSTSDPAEGEENDDSAASEDEGDSALTSGVDDADGDIAVLILKEASKAKPIPWNRRAVDDSIAGHSARIVGYGLTAPRESGGTNVVKKEAKIVISDISKGTIGVAPGPDNPCHGDSGGPMLLKQKGVDTVMAVGHVGFSETCVEGGNYTRTDRYADFIQKYVDQTR